jgi:hypothetical protein
LEHCQKKKIDYVVFTYFVEHSACNPHENSVRKGQETCHMTPQGSVSVRLLPDPLPCLKIER